MFRAALLGLVLVASSAPGADTPGSPKTETHQVKLNGHTFTLPKDFTIELAAGADLAPRPIVAAFDEKGRLYVCDSSGSNEKTTVQLEKKPHRILRLESTKGDGRFDKQTVYVKNVMLPEGAMWLSGSLYVAAPPHIMKFTDTDNDGVADKEEIWFDGKTLTGCANDLHGPYLGPDGWIYWTKGAFAKQEYTVNGKKFSTRAAHIFRAKPDGAGIEPVMTGGMDNPVDLVFTPGGDIIFSTTFFQHPRDGKRDGLVHAVYGGVYGKDHDVVYEHLWTSPQLMPVMTHMGPAAPSGLHRLESEEFGKDYANNIFCCQFNLRKVSRHVLVPTGSTYTTTDSDFVVSDNLDFHPTDVIEDADGSLLIVDTGGWYKLCCPTSQLVKPDVTGAIYRVKRTAHKVSDPRGLKIDWNKAKPEDLVDLLGDRRPVVQSKVIEALANREDGLRALARTHQNPNPTAYRNAIWAACRIDNPSARNICREGIHSDDRETALAALHAVALWRDKAAIGPLMQKTLSKDLDLAIYRATATAFGRIGDPVAVPTILNTFGSDRVLHHSVTYALIEIGDSVATAKGLQGWLSNFPSVRRGVLAALEQMPGGRIEPAMILDDLDGPDAALEETVWWIAGRHPEWGDKFAGYFRERLRLAHKFSPQAQQELTDRLARFAKSEALEKVIADAVSRGTREAKVIGLRVIARSGMRKVPESWVDAMSSIRERNLTQEILAIAKGLPLNGGQYSRVSMMARIQAKTPNDDLQIMAAAPTGQELERGDEKLVFFNLSKEQSAEARSLASEVLVRYQLSADQLVKLTAILKTVNPMELNKLVGVFAKSTDEKVGLALVKTLRDPAVRSGIRVEMVKPIFDKYPPAVKAEAEKLYAELAEARKGETARLDKLLAELKPGDVRRGQVVFNSAKTNCIACHKVGYVGGLVGPDLTRVGGIRTDRDLLEAIVFPSASFVRSYEPVRVVTTDDRTFNGILKKDAPDEIIIVVAADKEERVARADVASITPSAVSLMPSGLDQQLTPQDLADLVAFLRACK